MDNNYPCSHCKIKAWYAKKLDVHFSGEDCLFECELFENWKKEQKKGKKKDDVCEHDN